MVSSNLYWFSQYSKTIHNVIVCISRFPNKIVSIIIEFLLNHIGHIVPKKEKRGEWDISKLNQNVKFSWVQSVEDRHYWFCEWHVSVEWGEQKNVNGISIYAEE